MAAEQDDRKYERHHQHESKSNMYMDVRTRNACSAPGGNSKVKVTYGTVQEGSAPFM